MPVNEGGYVDPVEEDRLLMGNYVAARARQVSEWVIRDGDRAFREERLAREAAAAAVEEEKASRRERMVALAKRKRGRKPGSRPWQSLGITKAEWEATKADDVT